MSSLSSASTFAQIKAAYADNASYAEDSSVSKARAFVTACRLLLINLPAKSMHGKGGSVEFDVSLVQKQLDAANAWLSSQASGDGGVVFPSFDGLRGY